MTGPREHWAIVGGGMMGMALAYRLAGRGPRISLFEAAPQWGGLASCWSLNGVTWDRFYHVVLASDSSLRRLLDDIGIAGELRWTTTKTGFYDGRRLLPMSSSIDYLRFPLVGPVDKLRLAATILQASRRTNWEALERIPVETYLRRWSGAKVFDSIWLPLLRAKLGEDYRRISAAFIWAVIRRLYAARRSGLKRELFGYVQGGYGRVVSRLIEALAERGVELNLGHAAHEVCGETAGGLRLAFTNGRRETFDRIIITLPSTAVAALCPDLSPNERDAFAGIEYQGIVCASVLLRRPLTEYYLTYIVDSSASLTAVVEMSNLVDSKQLGGHSLVYLPCYAARGHPLFEASDGEVEARFLAALDRIHPGSRRDVVCARVARAKQVFALPVLNYSRLLPPMRTSVAGLHVVNSSYIVNGTLNVNETVTLADSYAGTC